MDGRNAFRLLSTGINFADRRRPDQHKPKPGSLQNSSGQCDVQERAAGIASIHTGNEPSGKIGPDQDGATIVKSRKRRKKKSNSSFSNISAGPEVKKLKRSKGATTNEDLEHQEMEKLVRIEQEKINQLRNSRHIYVDGADIPDPVMKFSQLPKISGHSDKILANIGRFGFDELTPIQMQAVPVMLEKREILGTAPTGSGKTLAFLVPILLAIEKDPVQKQKDHNNNCRVVILEPTRELAVQVHRVAMRLIQDTKIRCCHLKSGLKDTTNVEKLKKILTSDIIVATPNSLVSVVTSQRTASLFQPSQLEWLVVDESDKLFETGPTGGFREQLATIYNACAESNRHIKRAFFSATVSDEVEQWCRVNLDNMVKVGVGRRNVAVASVDQSLVFAGSEHGKLVAIRSMIQKGEFTPPVLIFVQSIDRAQQLLSELKFDGINVDAIHSDRPQKEREEVVRNFRLGKIFTLICTELLGRGIDFKGVNLVINYDFPPSGVSYIHRIGRTGRAGRQGRAVTFFTNQDRPVLRTIANVMLQAGCHVPEFMTSLKNPSKNIKKLRKVKPVKRADIVTSTTAKEKRARRSQIQKRLKKKGRCTSDGTTSIKSSSSEKLLLGDTTTAGASSPQKRKNPSRSSAAVKDQTVGNKGGKISKPDDGRRTFDVAAKKNKPLNRRKREISGGRPGRSKKVAGGLKEKENY